MKMKMPAKRFNSLSSQRKASYKIIKVFTKTNSNGNQKLWFVLHDISSEKTFDTARKLECKSRAPKKLGKPSKHVLAKNIQSIGNKPKIVTGNMFPNKRNIVHYEPKGSKDNFKYSYDPYKVFLKEKTK